MERRDVSGRRVRADQEAQAGGAGEACGRSMPVRQGPVRDRRAGALGLARPHRRQPPCAWRGLCDLCRQLEEALPHHAGRKRAVALRGCEEQDRAQFLRQLRHADLLRTRAVAAHGQHPARAVLGAHRPAAALPHRDRGVAGVGLHRRAAGAAEGLSGRGLAAVEKEEAQ